jgi:hypothetical protein
MLGKLIKVELKAGLRVIPLALIGILTFYLIGLLAKVLDIIQIQGTASFFIIVSGIAGLLITLIFVILRYYKGLFGAEGYLTQTLPVSKGSLIAAKVITAYLWTIISVVFMVLAVIATLHIIDFQGLQVIIDMVFGGNFTPLVIYVAISGATGLLVFLGEIYFAITLANTRLFMKNNILFSIVFFVGANLAVGMLELVAMLFIPLGITIMDSGVMWTTETMLGTMSLNFNTVETGPIVGSVSIGVGNCFVDVIAGIALLVFAHWLLVHKTSVK